MRMTQRGKYIDPSLPGIAYQLAHGARSVWATCPMPTLEQHRNRQRDRLYRDHLTFCSRLAVQHG